MAGKGRAKTDDQITPLISRNGDAAVMERIANQTTFDRAVTPLEQRNADSEKLLIVVRELFSADGLIQKANLTSRQSFAIAHALWFAVEYKVPELVDFCNYLLETSVAKSDGKPGHGRTDLRNILTALFLRQQPDQTTTLDDVKKRMLGG